MRRPEDQSGLTTTTTFNNNQNIKVENGDINNNNNLLRGQMSISQSGPQTPISVNFKRRGEFYRQQLKDDQHNRKCVFNALTNRSLASGYESDSSYIIKKKDPHHHQQQQQQQISSTSNMYSANATTTNNTNSTTEPKRRSPIDSHRDYVAVQQGQDIPFEGLRRPAPQPHAHQGE